MMISDREPQMQNEQLAQLFRDSGLAADSELSGANEHRIDNRIWRNIAYALQLTVQDEQSGIIKDDGK